MYSRRLNNQLLIVHSARIAVSVFKFHKKDGTHFACSSCESLGKNRVITTWRRTTSEEETAPVQKKMHFGMRIAQLYAYTFPHPSSYDLLYQEIIAYLRHASYLIAGNGMSA